MRAEVKFIVPFLLLIALSALYEYIATIIFHVNSAIWFRFYLLFEFGALFYFFYKIVHKPSRIWLYPFAALFIIAFLVLGWQWDTQNQYTYDSYLSVIETFLVYMGVILWFRTIFLSLQIQSLWQNPTFYFISGLTLYFSGTIFLFVCSDYLVDDNGNLLLKYWTLNIFFSFVLRILLIIGLWKGQQKLIRYSG